MLPGASNRGFDNGQKSLRRSRPYRGIRTNEYRTDCIPPVRFHHHRHLRRPTHTLQTRRCGGDHRSRHRIPISDRSKYSCSTGLHRRPDRRSDYTTTFSPCPRLTDKSHERVGQWRTGHQHFQKILCSLAKRPGISEVRIV